LLKFHKISIAIQKKKIPEFEKLNGAENANLSMAMVRSYFQIVRGRRLNSQTIPFQDSKLKVVASFVQSLALRNTICDISDI